MGEAKHIPSGLDQEVTAAEVKGDFTKSIDLLERLHQKLHDLIHLVLERSGITDITPVQALLVYNLGEHEIMVGELKTRGFYLGSNVSYNLKKLVTLGYVSQEKLAHDRRAARVALTIQGHQVRKIITALYDDDIEKILATCPLEYADIKKAVEVLGVWDQFWNQELTNFHKPK